MHSLKESWNLNLVSSQGIFILQIQKLVDINAQDKSKLCHILVSIFIYTTYGFNFIILIWQSIEQCKLLVSLSQVSSQAWFKMSEMPDGLLVQLIGKTHRKITVLVVFSSSYLLELASYCFQPVMVTCFCDTNVQV